MTNFTDQILQQLDPSSISAIASQLGLDPAQAQAAVEQAVPLVVGGLANGASTAQGASALFETAKAHSALDLGSILGSALGAGAPGRGAEGGLGGLGGLGSILGGMLGGGAGVGAGAGGGGLDAGAILGGLFGGRQDQAAQNLGKSSGIGTRNAGMLLAILAPIVMSIIGRMSQGKGLDAGGLGGALAQETQANRQGANGGLLGSVLDQDGDGQFGVSDLLKLGTQMFSGSRRA